MTVDSALDSLPLAMVSLLERRHLDSLRPDAWNFALEDTRQHPVLQRLLSLPRGEVPADVLAQALSAGVDPGHATVLVLDAAPGATSLHLGLRRTPSHALWSTADALSAQAAAFMASVPGTSFALPASLSEAQLPDLCSFLDRAPCLAAVTGSANVRPPAGRSALERLIHAAGPGRFALTLVAQSQPAALIDAMLDAIRRFRSEVHVLTRRSVVTGKSESRGVSVNNPDQDKIEIDKLPLILFAISVVAQLGTGAGPASPLASLSQPLALLATLANQRAVSHLRMTGEQHSSSRSTSQSWQVEQLDATAQACEQILTRYEDRLVSGRSQGWWRMAAYIAAEDEATLRRVCGAMQAMAIGGGPVSEPIRFTSAQRGIVRDAARRAEFIRIRPRDPQPWMLDGAAQELAQDSLTTLLTTEELAVIAALPSGEVAGLSRPGHAAFAMPPNPLRDARPTSALGRRSTEEPHQAAVRRSPYLGQVLDDRGLPRGPVGLDPSTLNRNTLVTGIVGSGKSTTCKRLLIEAYRCFRVPFLVVEPVKTEYRHLALADGFSDLGVFTIGDRFGLPLRLNPLEPIPGFPVGRHIDLLKAVFNAAFPMFAGMSQVLEESLIEVFVDRGWSIRRGRDPRSQLHLGELQGAVLVPNLRDLLAKIDTVIARKGYSGEVKSNLNAALRSRVAGLLMGQKALLLDTRRSVSAAQLFDKPAIIELQTLGDDDEKAFVMAVIFALLAEHAELRQAALPPAARDRLQHLTLIEEAHRLLSAARPAVAESADARGKAVAMFTDLLAELRAHGEGFIVADQIPTKLAPETLKNTAVKIVHRLTAPDDRTAMAGCLDLTEAQARHLNRLPPGHAVLHDPNLGDAILLAVDRLPETKGRVLVPPSSAAREYLRLGGGCEPCADPCRWRDEVEEISRTDGERRFVGALVEAALAGREPPAAMAESSVREPGLRYCALRAALHAELSTRVAEWTRLGALSGWRPQDFVAVERAMTALAPVMASIVAGVALPSTTWSLASAGLVAAIAAEPPIERPGCRVCRVRCRVQFEAAALRPRAERMATLVLADQEPDLRVRSYQDLARSLPLSGPDTLWCLAVQHAGEHADEAPAKAFMSRLRAELETGLGTPIAASDVMEAESGSRHRTG
jgi:DNA helicase HerA-like ATPase